MVFFFCFLSHLVFLRLSMDIKRGGKIYTIGFADKNKKTVVLKAFGVFGLREAAHRRDKRRQSVSTGYINSGQITESVIQNALQKLWVWDICKTGWWYTPIHRITHGNSSPPVRAARVPQNTVRATPSAVFCSTTVFCARKTLRVFLIGRKKPSVTLYVRRNNNWRIRNIDNI